MKGKPMAEFKKENHYLFIAYMELPKIEFESGRKRKGGNILSTVWREPDSPPGTYHLEVRFRYYADNKTFDSDDHKSFKSGIFKESDDVTATRSAKKALYSMVSIFGIKPEFIDLQCNGEDACRRIMANPPAWMHIKHLGGN